MEKLGKSIKAFREAQGLTIEQLADTLSVNKQELEYIETLEDEKSIVDGSFLSEAASSQLNKTLKKVKDWVDNI